MAKKILLFSPPFSGHLNVLKNIIWKYQEDFDFHLVITGWKNIQPDLNDITIPVTILARTNLSETDPAIWTLPRVVELMEDCLKVAREYKPDLIIYDFFSLEGNLVGKNLKIPYWASIPALIGPFTHQDYLNTKLGLQINLSAIKELQTKFSSTFNPRQIEMISDGLHIPGQKNLIWSYPVLTPHDFMTYRQPNNYIFVGYPASLNTGITEHQTTTKPLVYFSFGTVVMDNLWNQQVEIQDGLKTFVGHLANLSKNQEYDVIFVSRAKQILDNYPSNWHVIDYADQIIALSQASIFITHAGANSFHEAVLKKVPMIAIPFFGDQPLVASQIEKIGLGKNLVPDDSIDTKKSKEFLSKSLAEKTHTTIKTMLSNLDTYKNNFNQLKLESKNILDLLLK